jgi:hypothetical protein
LLRHLPFLIDALTLCSAVRGSRKLRNYPNRGIVYGRKGSDGEMRHESSYFSAIRNRVLCH